MNQTVINISGTTLSDACMSALSKGLSFSPTCNTNEFETKVDLFKFYRNLHLKAWYSHNPLNTMAEPNSNTEQTDAPSPFKPKSKFFPINNNACLTC